MFPENIRGRCKTECGEYGMCSHGCSTRVVQVTGAKSTEVGDPL